MARRVPMILAVLAMFWVSACAPTSFFVANIPVAFTDAQKYADISYGAEEWQKLDIFVPKTVSAPAPVLVFFYGGRWTFGNKEQYAFAALPFVERGYIVVIPDYSKYPRVKFPTFAQDAAQATAWVYDHIGAYHGDNRRLYLSGHSSGAHLAALVAVDPVYLQNMGKDRTIVSGFAGLAGPYDFIPEDEDLKDMFGPPEHYPRMQVPTFVDGHQPPMLLLHGADDVDVIQRNLNRLKAKIDDRGGVVESNIYPGIDHKEIIGALSWVWQDKAPVRDDMIDFFERHK